jgi:hypothetical protein
MKRMGSRADVLVVSDFGGVKKLQSLLSTVESNA